MLSKAKIGPELFVIVSSGLDTSFDRLCKSAGAHQRRRRRRTRRKRKKKKKKKEEKKKKK